MQKLRIENLFDLEKTISASLFTQNVYPWEILPKLNDFILDFAKTLDKNNFEEKYENVWISKSAIISENCYIKGPTIIDSNAEIRFGAFIRGSVIIGKNCVVGNSTELKNCILFDNVQTPHFNYVGDSIMGFRSHIGAGVVLSNVKSDKSNVTVKFDGQSIETGLRKFGAILGDYVEVGCNSVLNPGTIVGRKTTIYPLTMVRGCLDSQKIMKNSGIVVDKI